METQESQKSRARLYPAIEPFHRMMLDVPGGHSIYVEQVGNPNGIPVIVVHGGPGGGCGPSQRRFFNPDIYHVVLFDQRGCGLSRPHASVENNTTWDLIADMEIIREHLEIDHWILFGGSWGSTLSLLYAQTHPERVKHLVLRGIFLMTKRELEWFYGGGAARFFPERWEQFAGALPEAEQSNIIAAYARRLFGENEQERIRFAQLWAGWETSLAALNTPNSGPPPARFALAIARLENHYFQYQGFLRSDHQIIEDMGKICDIPGDIVQGRYDMVCPPEAAFWLHSKWPASKLHVMPCSGHALSEVEIGTKLVSVMDNLLTRSHAT